MFSTHMRIYMDTRMLWVIHIPLVYVTVYLTLVFILRRSQFM